MALDRTTRPASPAAQAAQVPARAVRFGLVRYFTAASLVAIALVGAALVWHERQQAAFFHEVQSSQARFFADVQKGFAKQRDEDARADLVAIHESGSVNVARVFANSLWARDLAPFVARAQPIAVGACRAVDDAGERKACFADVGERIRALPEFRALDAKVFDVMRRSTVFKIKVYDLRGITVYSSEHGQVGEDKSGNPGYLRARGGAPASQISHRDRFSAFEGVVNDRDLMESYVPVTAPGGDEIVAVFEVYSDVTPFLARLRQAAERNAAVGADNARRLGEQAERNERLAQAETVHGVFIVAVLLAALFAALYLVVRSAERIMDAQAAERERLQQQIGQSEKMAALGQMVAGVCHQLNTPLAFTQSNVNLMIDRLCEFDTPLLVAAKIRELARSAGGDSIVLNLGRSREAITSIGAEPQDVETMREMLRDVLRGLEQMQELVVNMREFTRLDRAAQAEVDVNQGLKTVVYMARSVIPNEIAIVEEYGRLPALHCNASQLNQVFLNLVTNAAQAICGRGRITVRTESADGVVRIQVADTGAGIPPEVLPRIFESFYTTKPRGVGTGLGLPIAREIVRQHGGEIHVDTEPGKGTTFTVLLPVRRGQEMKLAA